MGANERRKHPLRILFAILGILIVLWIAFTIFKGSSAAKSFRGSFLTTGANFSTAYTYTSGRDTYYLLFGSNVKAVWLTSSKSGKAYLTTYQGEGLANGVDSVFYYSEGTCHRNFKYQEPGSDSVLLVTETSGVNLPVVYAFEKANLEVAKTALDEMKTVYDVSKP